MAVTRSVRFLVNYERQCFKYCCSSLTSVRGVSSTPATESVTRSFDEVPAPPGMYKWPYLGLPLHFVFNKFSPYRFDLLLKHYRDELGDIFKLKIQNSWVVVLCDPKYIEAVLRVEGKYPIRPPLPIHEAYYKRKPDEPFITVVHGEEWQKLRKLAQKPLMKPSNVAKYIPKLSEVADDFVAKYANKDRMDNFPDCCYEYSTEGAGTLCFDTRLGCIGNAENNANSQLMRDVNRFFEMTGKSLRSFPWFRWFETPFFKEFVKVYDGILRVSYGYVNEAFQRVLSRNEEHDPEEANLIMDMLMVPNTSTKIVEKNVVDLFIGAVESTAVTLTFLLYQLSKNPDVQEEDKMTAVTLTFLLYQLAKNPDVQQRLFEELEKHVQPKGHMSADVMEKLPYLKCCLKESFRSIFPVSTGASRFLRNEIVINDYRFPPNVLFMFANSLIGNDERYFAEPEKFKPERWLRSEQSAPINQFSVLPFGFGPRNCLGQRFAELEIYISVAKIVRNFKLTLQPGVTEVPHMYMTFVCPAKPFSIMLEKRM